MLASDLPSKELELCLAKLNPGHRRGRTKATGCWLSVAHVSDSSPSPPLLHQHALGNEASEADILSRTSNLHLDFLNGLDSMLCSVVRIVVTLRSVAAT